MKKIFTRVSIIVAFMALSLNKSSVAQMVGDQIFLKGKWVEVGVAPNGSLGSTVLPPTGVYHCNSPTFTFWDPGSASSTTSNQRLMMVFDAGHDGWTTGTPGFFGDYSMPGTPYEGWGIQINGSHSEAQAQYYMTTGTTGFAGGAGLTGNNSAYLNPSGKTIGVWSGTAASGALQITQRTTLDTNASWVNMNVKLKNVSGTTLTGVYYIRETDPDNDQTAPGGSFITSNVINYQNDYLHRVMVTATGTLYTTQTLSLATKDCRAKCYIHSGWPMSTATNLATLYSSGGGGFTFSGSVYGDVAIGLIFNCGNIAAGDSTELNYTYIFNGLTGIDSSLANPQLVVNGIPRDTTDTVTSCSFSGSSLACSIVNGSTADWFGSTWTWAPSTYLAATTGLTNTIAVSSITAPITYTITGTTALSGCTGKTFLLTVMPPGTTPAPTTTTSLSYCLGATAAPLSATGIGTIRWFTSIPGTGSTTPPTPSTSAVGTTTYWVSQTVAGCPSDTIPITVTVFALGTVTTGSLYACTGYTTTLSNATAGGTWSSSNLSVGTVGSTTGIVYGVSAGTTNITYHVLGCIDVKTVTVTPTPGAITGLSTVCIGTSTTLSNSVPGGSWQTSSGNISVGSSTGIVTGISVGTGVVTYNMGGGCYVTRVMTVNPFPSAIAGPSSVCVGASVSLSSSTPGGVWTSTPVTIASVGALTGIVTGTNPGTTTIKYTVGGCAAQLVVTVVSAAPPIIGPGSVCIGSTISMSTASPGGTWSAACPTILSINPSTGVVTGVGTGTCIITYAVSAGCTDTAIINVTPAPPAITGNVPLCVGQTNTLTHPTTGGTWSLACPSIATVGLGTGLVTALSSGTCVVTYTLPSGCISVATLTVNPTTAPITGTTTLCQGSTTTLSNATPGGTWSSSGASASVGATTGTWTAGTAGTATITYTPPSGCIATTVVTAVALPSAIVGTSPICAGQTVTWTSTPAGGVWSTMAVGVATVSGTGDVTGTGAGTTTISYTLPSGCGVGKVVTVNAAPAPITGSLGMCVGGTTTLSSITSGGTWSAGCGGILTLLSPGFYGGSGAGTCTVSYTVSGCAATAVVTVNTLPAAIGGSLSVCNGDCTTLTNTSTGGTWSSSNTAVATIGSLSGVMCGVSNGTAIITYSLGSGCITTSVITVNALPGGITGTLAICQGASVTLSSTPAGGSWSSDLTSVVAIGSSSGVATGGSVSGTATISYSLSTGCRRTVVMTVNAAPSPILGLANVCVGTCTTLTSTPAGGTWSTSNGNATIGATTGVACGAFAGTTTVTYTLPTGCYRTMTLLINALPTGISPSGSSLQVCEGSTLSLTGSPAGGTWMSAPTTVGTISAGGGTLAGITPGTVAVTYTLPTGCSMSAVATVNALPGTITGVLTTCVGQTTTLGSTPAGGTWSVSGGTGGASIVSSTGVLTGSSGGTVVVTYTSTAGCRRSATVTVYALPGTITGGGNLCPGGTTTVACLPAGGTWSVTPGTGTATISSSGVITGGSAGSINVSYTLGTGCISTRVITVNTPPNPITGTLTTCVGSTTTLNSTTAGGVWTSVPSTVASVTSIGTGTGEVTGVNAGTSLISYTDPATTCRATAQVTVYALPGSIGGALNACIGQCSALTNSATGGTWASSNAAVGTINTTTGMFCGISSGTTNITYTLGTGCNVTAVASVNPLPLPITGTAQVCQGATTTLSNASGSGTWSSSNITVATVTSGGVVTGVTPGTATISYTLPTLCASTVIVTVYALPTAITGTPVVCENSTITLGSTPAGGVWSSSSSNVAVNPVTGDVTGVTAGTATVVYTQGIGCTRSVVVSVNPLPAAITGTLDVCLGRTVTLANATSGGTWNSSNPLVAPIDAAGVVSGLALGTSTISYTLSTGCARSVIATVHAFPSPIVGSSGFCNLTSTTYLSTPGGGTWTSSNPSIFTVHPVTGTATGANVGTATLTYTATYGCEVTKDITIILAPYPVTGDSSICLYDTVTLNNIISGGIWTTSNALVLPLVDAYSGKVIGASVGTGQVTYTLSTGCSSFLQMTVNNIPSTTTGTPQVCEASTMVLTNTTPGGTWMSSNNSIATIGSVTGFVSGISAGTVIMSYVLVGSGCNAQFVVTVNPLPDTITGPNQVCVGSTIALVSGPAGGVWSTASSGTCFIDPSTGIADGVTAGVTQITYTLPTTCQRSTEITVNPLPADITGVTDICVNDVTTYSCITPGGMWSVSNPAVGTISTSGVYTALSAGSNTISYTLITGCFKTHPVTNHANPAPISGMTTVCAGFATNLYSGPAGGVWSQTPTSMVYGTINPVTGVVSGIMAGYIPVTYTLGTGCNTIDTVEVITLPSVIGGTPNVCINDTTFLTSVVAGGSWSSSNTARAIVDPMSGAVVGISAGTAVITYTVGTGCFNVLTITVNPLPAPITGTFQVCEQSSTILNSVTPGGAWISSNTAVGSVFGPIGPALSSTTFTGVSAGTTVVTYMLFTGCKTMVTMTVNATPAPITGNPHICMGASNTFTTTSTGGVWSTSNPAIATINPVSGVATSVSLGVVTISYTYPGTGCTATRVVTVQPLPQVFNVTGGGNFCAGGTGVHVNLSGSQPGVSYELYYSSSATGFLAGTGFPLDFGLHTAGGTYTVQATNVTSGCKRNMAGAATIVVNPLVTPVVTIATMPNDSVCEGETVAMTAMPTFGGTAPTYAWKVNGTFVSTANNYSYIPANGDIVTVTMTSNYNCTATPTATGTQALTVMPSATPIAGVISTPSDTVCQFNPVTFTAAPTYGGTTPSYTWLVNGATTAFGPTFTYVPEDGDIVNLRMTSDYRCRTTNTVVSGDVTMSVDSIKLPTVTVTPEPGAIIAAGKPVTLHAWASNAGPNPTFQWKVNSVLVPGATSDTYTAIFDDYDSISVNVISSGVCHNIGTVDWFFIGVAPLSTSQASATISDLRLVPNPNKGTFTISGNLAPGIDEDVNVDVTDMLGQVVFRGVVKAKNGRMESRITLENNLANGMYMLTLRTNGEQKVFHFVMEQ